MPQQPKIHDSMVWKFIGKLIGLVVWAIDFENLEMALERDLLQKNLLIIFRVTFILS
jgi:hypothetical protein